MHQLRSFALALVLIVLPGLPVAAMGATPAASPAASPVSGVGGWRVTKDRALALAGEASSLSPDGQWIAGRGDDGAFCVWATKDGAATCQGENLAIRPETITWAPDSSAVAFSLNAIQFFIDSDIYVFEIKTQKLHDITDDGISGSLMRAQSTLGKPIPVDDVPTWSPDGTELAFVRTNWGEGDRPTELMRIRRTGGTPTLIRTIDSSPFAIYEPMTWLPDNRILFTVALTEMKNSRNGLWQIGVNGKGLKLLLAGDSAAQIPAPWLADISPDGTFASVYSPLILGQFAGKQDAFFLVDLTGFDAVPITSSHGSIVAPPLFSPDGRALLYPAVEGQAMRLVVQDLATGKETVLIDDLNAGDNPAHFGRASGIGWARDNTVLIQTGSGARLLTLASME